MKKTLLIGLVVLISCTEEPIRSDSPDLITITEADGEVVQLYREWLGQKSQNHRLAVSDFQAGKVYRIRNNETLQVLYSAVSTNDEGQTISFMIDDSNSITNEFRSKVKLEGSSIVSEVYTIEGDLMFVFEDDEGGNRKVRYRNTHLRTKSWWGAFDDCFDKLGSPFESAFANWTFAVVVEAATVGLYYPATILVCAGVATAS